MNPSSSVYYSEPLFWGPADTYLLIFCLEVKPPDGDEEDMDTLSSPGPNTHPMVTSSRE